MRSWSAPLPDEHDYCEPPWFCLICGRAVCPRCEDPPKAPSFCEDCA